MKKKFYLVSYHEKTGAERTEILRTHKVPNMGKLGLFSRSRAYDTKEELLEAKGIQKEPCVKCGGLVTLHYNNKEELIKHGMCFSCNHWRGIAATKHKRTIVDGSCYTVCAENASGYFRGFGGAKFIFKNKKTGEITESTNVWHQGTVPPEWKEELPDTHESVKQ